MRARIVAAAVLAAVLLLPAAAMAGEWRAGDRALVYALCKSIDVIREVADMEASQDGVADPDFLPAQARIDEAILTGDCVAYRFPATVTLKERVARWTTAGSDWEAWAVGVGRAVAYLILDADAGSHEPPPPPAEKKARLPDPTLAYPPITPLLWYGVDPAFSQRVEENEVDAAPRPSGPCGDYGFMARLLREGGLRPAHRGLSQLHRLRVEVWSGPRGYKILGIDLAGGARACLLDWGRGWEDVPPFPGD